MTKSVFAIAAAATFVAATQASAFSFDMGQGTVVIEGNTGMLSAMCDTTVVSAPAFSYDEATSTFTTASGAGAASADLQLDVRLNDAGNDGAWVLLGVPAAGLAGASLTDAQGQIVDVTAGGVGTGQDAALEFDTTIANATADGVTEALRNGPSGIDTHVEMRNLNDGSLYEADVAFDLTAVHGAGFVPLSNNDYSISVAYGCLNSL